MRVKNEDGTITGAQEYQDASKCAYKRYYAY